MSIFYGTTGDDTIQGALLDASVTQIDALAGNDRVVLSGEQAFIGGPGNDTILGSGSSQYQLFYVNSEPVVDLQSGIVSADGFGGVDHISGVSSVHTSGGAAATLYGDAHDNIFSLNYTGNSVDGRDGNDIAVFTNRRFAEFAASFDGDVLSMADLASGHVDRLQNIEVLRFADRTVDVAVLRNDRSADYWDTTSVVLPDLTGIYEAFQASGPLPAAINVTVLDMNGDGRDEIVVHLFQNQSVFGTATDGPVRNQLLILSRDAAGAWHDATTELLAAGTVLELSGQSRQNRVADLNGDGLPDIAWAVSKEDGRSGDSDNKASTNLLLSDAASGRYAIVTLDDYDWFHGIGAAPMLNDGTRVLPGVVIDSGFQVGQSAWRVDAASQVTAEAISLANDEPRGAHTLMHLAALDGNAAGSRYFFAAGTALNADVGIIERSVDGTWSSTASVSLGLEFYRDATFVTWQQTEVTVPIMRLGDNYFVYYLVDDAQAWRPSPGAAPLVVANFNAGVVAHPDADRIVQLPPEVLNANYLLFFQCGTNSIAPANVPIAGEQPMRDANFIDVLDFNRDGYDDVVAYNYCTTSNGPVPLAYVYLNDTQGRLYNAGLDWYLPQPIDATGESAKFIDANGDGLWDLFRWPATQGWNGAAETAGLYRIELGTREFSTGPGFINPSTQGAPGFNEHYYLQSHPDVAALVADGTYTTGLAHYLAVGRAAGLAAFAPDVWVHGSAGADVILLREGNEKAFGYGGADALKGLSGDDTLDGGPGADTLQGGDGADTLYGQQGNDRLFGGLNSDRLEGGPGGDTFDGGPGADTLMGGEDNDTYLVTRGDTVTETAGAGKDLVLSSIDWTLGANVESLTLTGSDSVAGTGNGLANLLQGNAGQNQLNGRAGDDTLIGGTGNDMLIGDVGRDTLSGGAGDDLLRGGDGVDKLRGGDGADVFQFDTAVGKADFIVDIDAGVDRLRLDDDIFRAFHAGVAVGGAQFLAGAGVTGAQTTTQHLIYDTSSGTLYYDVDGAGGGAAVAFAVLGVDGHRPLLSVTDFEVIA